jgi:hypothetical protein
VETQLAIYDGKSVALMFITHYYALHRIQVSEYAVIQNKAAASIHFVHSVRDIQLVPPLQSNCATRARPHNASLRCACCASLRPFGCAFGHPLVAQCPYEGETLFFKPKAYGRRHTAWCYRRREMPTPRNVFLLPDRS